MNNLKLSVHHVGGRAGSRSFPHIKKFEKDIVNTIYDADEDCIEQIKDRNISLESELHVLPYALSDKCKPSTLNINYDPYTSSLLESNKSVDSFYVFSGDHDYIMGETAKTVEKRDVEVVSIDHIFNSKNLHTPKPDFLSIDVEGGEYDVLKGAIETMKSSIMAVYAEVTFLPLRNGQKSFGDLCDFLSIRGFHFVSFANSGDNIFFEELSPYRYPIGLRGRGFHTLSEALFLRRISAVENMLSNNLVCYINLRKLAFIAIVYDQIEYGLECLRFSRIIEKRMRIDLMVSSNQEPNYLKFLNELEQAEENYPKLFPKTFKSVYTFEESKGRFDLDNKETKYRLLARKIPGLRMLYRLAVKIKHDFTKKLGMLLLLKSGMEFFFKGNSKIEKVFIKYLLFDQARLLKQKRITQECHVSEE